MFRFLHIADVHLGKYQHQSAERYGDYFVALQSVVDHALREKVDALLIAGDLFDEQEPAAETIRRAARALRPLRENGIPVYAIEGNHDRRKRTEPACALDILAGEGYLHLLRPSVEDQKLALPEYDQEQGGALVEAAEGVVIAGLGFLGHSIEEYHRQAAEQLPDDDFVILLSHAMVATDEQTLEYGCIAYDDLAPLRERVGYLALGHRHTRVGLEGEMDGWVFNPGSLEYVNSLDYRLPADLRGFYDVALLDATEYDAWCRGELQLAQQADTEHAADPETTVETRPADSTNRPDNPAAEEMQREHVSGGPLVRPIQPQRGLVANLVVSHIPTEKRPALTLRPDITGCAHPDEVVAAVRTAADDAIDADLRARRPIVIVRLQGELALSRSRLPRAAITQLLQEEYDALHVEVMDRDLLGTVDAAALLVDDGDLEQVADRARAIAADLLKARGIAVGREADLSAALIDMKTQLHGSAKSPSKEVLQAMRQQLLPFVEYGDDIVRKDEDSTTIDDAEEVQTPREDTDARADTDAEGDDA